MYSINTYTNHLKTSHKYLINNNEYQTPYTKQAQKKNDKGYSYFKINEIMRKKIKEIIDINFKETLKDLEQYFNGKIFVGDVRISRNYNLDQC